MHPTRTITGTKAREIVYKGVNAIFIPVSKTFGPEGKNALIYRTYNRGPRITNDGVTVAEVQEPKNPFIRIVAEAFKEVCKRTGEKVGDGTTATTIIAGKLYTDIYRLLSEGQSEFLAQKTGKVGVMSLRKKILQSVEDIKEKIKKAAKKIETLEELENIATVSIEDERLGKVVAKMAWEVGIDGHIDVVEGYKGEIETEMNNGMKFPAKVAAKAFVNNPARYEMIAQDCPVFITNYAMDNAAEFAKVFQDFNKITSKLIVIAPSFADNVLINMVNATKQGYFLYPVAVPSLRIEQFEDLSIYCGANFIDKNKGKKLKNADKNDLGFLEKLIVKDIEAKEETIATGGKGERFVFDGNNKEQIQVISPLQERINILKKQLEETHQEQFKKLLERRIASMASAIGTIRVGDSTQASSLYKKLKVEDGVYACKAALRGGYVKGGGLCLQEIAKMLPDDNILKSCLMACYEQIQESVEGGVEITDNIIDPAEVIYYSVEHAISVVANLATVETITIEDEDIQPGDGYMAIARAINEYVISQKRHLGQLKEAEEELERDRMNGLTIDEAMILNNEY